MCMFATAAVRELSIMLALLAAICFGIALGDIIYTVVTICDETPACSPVSVAVILTYVGSGLWASIFVCFLIMIIIIIIIIIIFSYSQ